MYIYSTNIPPIMIIAVGIVKQLCCGNYRQNVIFEAESKTTK